MSGHGCGHYQTKNWSVLYRYQLIILLQKQQIQKQLLKIVKKQLFYDLV